MALSLPSFTQDQQYPFHYLRMGMGAVSAPGVVLAGDMLVSPASGLQVQIAAGEAYVQQTVSRLGAFYASRGLYYVFNDGVANPYNSIAAPTTNPRIDQVVARVYDVYEQSLGGTSFWRYEWVPGTETSGADLTNLNGAAALPDNSLRLAYVVQDVGEGTITSDDILNVSPRVIGGQQDMGWVPFTFNASWSTTPQGFTPSYRLLGDRVWWKGSATYSGGGTSSFPFVNVPASVRPSGSNITEFVIGATSGAGLAQVFSTGVVSVTSISTGQDIFLDGASYTLS